MDSFLRLLLRFIIVPLGYLAAVTVGACVIVFGSWKTGSMMLSENPDAATAGFFAALVAGPVMFVVLASSMWLPGSVGILISEAFAIRSWIFHALNGAISGWVGWQLFSAIDQVRHVDERAEVHFRRRACGRLCLLGGGGLERGFLEAGVPAAAWAPPPATIRSIRPREQKPDGERAHQSGEQVVDCAHDARRAADRAGEAFGREDQHEADRNTERR